MTTAVRATILSNSKMTGRNDSWRSTTTTTTLSGSSTFSWRIVSSVMWRSGRDWNVLLPAAHRSRAAFAPVIMLDAERDALRQQLEDQIIDPQRHRHVIFRLWKFSGRVRGDAWNVAGPMFPRPEEKRADDDPRRAALDAFR